MYKLENNIKLVYQSNIENILSSAQQDATDLLSCTLFFQPILTSKMNSDLIMNLTSINIQRPMIVHLKGFILVYFFILYL